MRQAGSSIAAWLDAHIPTRGNATRHAIALVGPGNNGGDALTALARLIELGWTCAALTINRDTFGILPCDNTSLARVGHATLAQLEQADVIIDGVFGIGGRAELAAPLRATFAAADAARRRTRAAVIALDIASGVNADTGDAAQGALAADVTLCLGYPKIGLLNEPAASLTGELYVLPLSIPEPHAPDAPQLLDAAAVQGFIPPRAASSHKSTVGSLLIVGGAASYYGAPRLAGEAAARIGAGLVTLAVPATLVPVIAAQVPELTFVSLPPSDGAEAAATLDSFLRAEGKRYSAALIGPGLGRGEHADTLLSILFGEHAPDGLRQLRELPLTLDADALNWISAQDVWPVAVRDARAVLTPHPGEMARLRRVPTGAVTDDPVKTARSAATEWHKHVVLKTGYSPLATPDGQIWHAPRATPELATAGTGDVLAGLIAGALAQGMSLGDAARLALYVGAMAGRRARSLYGARSVIARDVIDAISSALRDISEARVQL